MISNKVLITYKRKRLSANASPANVVKADSLVKTTEEHCFWCGSVDVNENLLVCHSCSGSYHLRCVESSFKYVPEERWQCSHCTKRCNFEVSIEYKPQQAGKITENENIEESETGTTKLCSQKVLGTRPSEDSSRKGSPSPVDTSINKINNATSTDNLDTDSGSDCRVVEEISRSQSTNLETAGRSSSVGLSNWTQRNTSSKFSEDCVSIAVNSDKRSGITRNDDYPKENSNTTLITFHRRVKKKQDINDASITRKSTAEDKQSSLATGSSHDLGHSFKIADSTFLLEADEGRSPHALQQEDVPRECNQISLQERLLMTKPDNPTYEKQKHEGASNNSSIYTDFLDLSFPSNSGVPEVSMNDSQSMSLPLDLSVKGNVDGYNWQLRWHSMSENASGSRQKQLLENNLIGSQMLKESTLVDKLMRFSQEWSEEDLDLLWIGVRRHGLNNWNAILSDPKLCFSKSRVAEDLAEQWDKDQINLLDGVFFQPVRPSPDLSGPLGIDETRWGKAAASNLYSDKVFSPVYSEFPSLKTEAKLSLGDVYIQNENDTNKNVPHLSGLSASHPHAIKNPSVGPFIGSNLIGSTNPRAGIRHQNAFKTQYTRYDCESSISHQTSVERVAYEQRSPANSTLPHWLKEVLTMPQRRSSLPLPGVSSFVNSMNTINKAGQVTAFSSAGETTAPPKDSCRRGILKMKSMTSSNNAPCLKVSDNSVPVDDTLLQKRFSLLPNLGLTCLKPTSVSTGSGASHDVLDLNKTSSDPIGPSNLVIIDSDASSEETISDDQSSRW